MQANIKLTDYSHGAGCGCKISPQVLNEILKHSSPESRDINLLVGNGSRDDAAVYDLGNGQGVISTTDFFMPIVDDPFEFGQIAAANAISDIYAMGGKPIMAIAILGWPINRLSPRIANQVLEGGRSMCAQAGIQLAGGHSIDAPEPIFGLAVTGTVSLKRLKRNNKARTDSKLFLTKPLGIGILSTAQKQNCLLDEHQHIGKKWMCKLNDFGYQAAKLKSVSSITDVTGFGLLGHLTEMCLGSGVSANVFFDNVPVIEEAWHYLDKNCIPGGTGRNFESNFEYFSEMNEAQRLILCDPQTSGGLLIAVDREDSSQLEAMAKETDCFIQEIGELKKQTQPLISII